MKVTKPALVVFLSLVAIFPWAHGGKDPAGLLASGLLLALALFLLVRSKTEARPFDIGNWKSPTPWWFGLLTWGSLSLVWSVNRYQSILWLAVLGLSFGAYAIGLWLSNQSELQKRWRDGYVVIAAATSVWGMVLYVMQSYNRLTASYYLANPAAAFLLPALLLGAWSFISTGRKWLLAAVPLVAAGWLLADSRSSFVLGGFVLLALATTRLSVQMWKRVGLLILATALVYGVVQLARGHLQHSEVTPGARFSELASGDSTSGSDRWYYLRSTAAILKKYPVLGSGAGTFASIHPQYQYRVISGGTNAHNWYAQTSAELGIPGMLLAAGWVLALLWAVLQSFRRRHHRALALVLVVMLVHLGLDIDAIYPSIVMVLGVLAGLVSAPLAESSSKRLSPVPIALAISALLLVPLTSNYLSSLHLAHAKAWQDNSEYPMAITEFSAAHHLITYDPDVVSAEGIAHFTMGGVDKSVSKTEYNSALRLARQAEVLDPLDAQHHFLEARVLTKQGNLAGAIAAYKRTTELDRYNHPEYYVDLANLYYQNNQPQQAYDIAKTCLDEYPDSVVTNRSFVPGIRTQLSLVAFLEAASGAALKHDNAEVSKLLKRALQLDPNNAYAQSLQQIVPAQ